MATLPPVPHSGKVTGEDGILTQVWADFFKHLIARVGGPLSERSHTATGYQKLPSGIYLQWGVTGAVASGATESETFGIDMPNACLQAFAGVKDNSAVATSSTGQYGTGNYAVGGFDIYNRTSVSLTFNWLAVGY